MHRLTAFFFLPRKENMKPNYTPLLPADFIKNGPYKLKKNYCQAIRLGNIFGNINPCSKGMYNKPPDPRSCPEQQWKMFCFTNPSYPLCKKPFEETRMVYEMEALQLENKPCNGKYNNICGELTSKSTCAVTIPQRFGDIYSR